MFLEVEEGGQDLDEEAVKVYLIRFIADLIGRPTTCFYSLSSVFPLWSDQLIIMSLLRYLKPSADSGGTHNNL